MADDGLKFAIEGKEYSVDNDFALGELEWLEEYVGQPLTSPGAFDTIKAAVGVIFLVKKREDPSFTIEQARGLNMSALAPVEPPKKRPTKPAAV
jgi:hypothetical protein